MDERDRLLADAQRVGRLPSVVGGLTDATGQLRWHGSAGEWAAQEGGWPGEPTDVQYRIGSITKTMTAVLLWQARDAGRLDLDEPLSSYLPGAPYANRPVRLLMGHVAGLPKEPVGPWWERNDGGDLEALLADNTGRGPMAGPGEEFRYSNLGYGLLGGLAERVLGEPWWDLVTSRVLGPLGMSRTTYQATGPHAQGWSVRHLDATLVPEPHSDTGAMAPAGQVWSTLADLARYAAFLLAGHPDVVDLRVLEEASAELLPGTGYGLGLRVQDGLVGHTGTMPGFMASLFCDRSAGAAYVGMANGTIGQDSVALARTMLAAPFTSSTSSAPSAPSAPSTPSSATLTTWRPQRSVPEEVAALLGSWRWGERPFELRWDAGPSGEPQLQLVELRPAAPYEEYERRDGRWIGTDGTELEVVRGPGGQVDHLLSETYELRRP